MSCRVNCKNFEGNRIVVSKWQPRGLGDRTTAIAGAGNLAVFLCAMLVMDTPQVLLDPLHNLGRPSAASWSRYLDTERIDDRKPFMIEKSGINMLSINESTKVCLGDYDVMMTTTKHNIKEMPKFIKHAARLADENQTFCWHIAVEYWDWPWPRAVSEWIDQRRKIPKAVIQAGHSIVPKKRLAHVAGYNKRVPMSAPPRMLWSVRLVPYIESQCDYVLVRTSNSGRAMVQNVLALVNATKASDVATLHVRRRDTFDQCNTSIPATIQYLRCSGVKYLPPGTPFVFFSDDSNTTYRKQLLSTVFNEVSRNGAVPVYDGESLIQNMIRQANQKQRVGRFEAIAEEDNYFTYLAASTIIGDAGWSFNMARCFGTAPCGQARSCHPCSSLPFPYNVTFSVLNKYYSKEQVKARSSAGRLPIYRPPGIPNV